MKPSYEELETRIEELERLLNDSKLNESKYKVSEEKYKRIFENVQDLFFQADINGIITEVSPSVNKYLGYDRQDLIGSSSKNLYNQIKDREELINQLLKKGEVNDFEVCFKRKDNQSRYFSFNAHLSKDEHGNVIGTEGTIRDISDKKKAEEIILASERRFRALVENSYDAIILLDKNGIIKYRTPSSARMSGVKDDEIIGKNFSEFIHSDDLDKTIQALSSILENPEKSQKLLFRRLAPNKKWIYLDSIITNMLNEPSVEAIVVNLQDVTVRIENEEKIQKFINELNDINLKLTESELKFRLILDYCSDWEMFRDPNNKVLYCSPSIEKIMGYTPEEYIKLSIADVIYPEDFHLAASAHSKLTQKAEYVDPVTFRLIKKNGDIIWVEVYGLPVFAPDGTHIGSRTSTHDITKLKTTEFALKKSETELKEANTTKDKFFSIIAHDLKNPLGSFRAISKLLFEDFDSFEESEKREFIEVMKNSADSLYRLLENLLEWSRAQRGKIEFNPIEFNLKLLSIQIFNLLKGSAENKKIVLVNKIPTTFPIFADENMLNTVLRNLITNAIKFTNQGGKITLDAIYENNEINISVSDSGVGMNSETINKLFRIDTKVSALGTNNETGTGLGLILCKEFVEKHGGKIWVESEIGKGSTFYFSLPNLLVIN